MLKKSWAARVSLNSVDRRRQDGLNTEALGDLFYQTPTPQCGLVQSQSGSHLVGSGLPAACTRPECSPFPPPRLLEGKCHSSAPENPWGWRAGGDGGRG